MLFLLEVKALALSGPLVKHLLQCWLVDGLVCLMVQLGNDLIAKLREVLGMLPQLLEHARDSLLGSLQCANQLLLQVPALLHLSERGEHAVDVLVELLDLVVSLVLILLANLLVLDLLDQIEDYSIN